MTDTAADTLQLELQRVFAHPRERVFDAWTRPEALAAWMGPTEAIRAESVCVDLREGGHYRIEFVEAGEPRKRVEGTYLTVRRPERLMFTWVWAPPFPDAGVETTVIVDFSEVPGGTRVHLRHLRFATPAVCELHLAGWNGTLDKFARRLEHGLP
ncbi:MAG: SRPBCC domain-containing protein [Rhodocyclaceae bacterium]|nr:SRPBCC domain-containing protein [Rhodocyclaceae bacterium]